MIFAVKNPSTVPSSNKWTVRGMQGDTLAFLEIIPGYLYGQQSPKAVSAMQVQGSNGVRRASMLGIYLDYFSFNKNTIYFDFVQKFAKKNFCFEGKSLVPNFNGIFLLILTWSIFSAVSGYEMRWQS